MKRLLTVPEGAARLGLPPARVRELGRQGLLPVVHIGRQIRIDPDQLEEWIRRGGQALPGGWRRERG